MIARRAAISSSSSLWSYIESYSSTMNLNLNLNLNLMRWVNSGSSRDTGGRTADPNVYFGPPEGVDKDQAVRGATARNPQAAQKHNSPNDDVTNPVKSPHSTPTLKSTGTNPPTPNSTGKQKRSFSSLSSSPVCSAGPAVDDDHYYNNDDATTPTGRSEFEDNKKYFSHNKPSPLSEIEVADTRKPLTQATDTNDAVGGGRGEGKGKAEKLEYFQSGWGENVWRPEQLESAEETMERAVELWRLNKMRGADPDAPHSRILRQLKRRITHPSLSSLTD